MSIILSTILTSGDGLYGIKSRTHMPLWPRPGRCITLPLTHALRSTKLDDGLSRLHSADDDAVQWLVNPRR